jgi:serine/threonine-protein kinase TNNI3K
MVHQRLRLAVGLAAFGLATVAATTYDLSVWYADSDCGGTPYKVFISDASSCSSDESCIGDSGSGHYPALKTVCTTDFKQAVKTIFGDAAFLLKESFSCSDYGIGEAYFASGNCEGGEAFSDYAIATLHANGSAMLQEYNDSLCTPGTEQYEYNVDKDTLDGTTCDDYYDKWYSSNDFSSGTSSEKSSSGSDITPAPTPTPSLPSSDLSTAAIIGIVVCSVVVVILVIVAVLCCKRRSSSKSTESQLQPTASLGSAHAASFPGSMQQHPPGGLWDDEVIVTKRIPRDKVRVLKLISQGAYGEVYSGIFNGQQVAVKMLLPVARTNLQHVNEFLAEAKMTAIMDHPHIVSFVGVAWDSLSDVCVVLEFMDGGDLRSLLSSYEEKRRPVGFDRQKVTIALHVCHALAYLHSLRPPVIHRDLKSRNVLLNRAMEAKLSDFGISRERMERTMTAGVGTSLWMAPEVMLGEWYDDKADMFSFGVLLSELDVHSLPYSNAKQMNRDHFGRQMPQAVLLQQIASGNVRVEFSEATSTSISGLGYACVSVDPRLRPSAAEVLYKLQMVLAQEM